MFKLLNLLEPINNELSKLLTSDVSLTSILQTVFTFTFPVATTEISHSPLLTALTSPLLSTVAILLLDDI